MLPGVDAAFLGPLVHLEAGTVPRWQRRLAVMGGDDMAERLSLSRAESGSIRRIRDEIGTSLAAAALGWRLGKVEAEDVILCRAAVLQMPLPDRWRPQIEQGARATNPVTAADLMPALTGPALGEKLRQIEQRWLASDLTLTKAQLLA